MTEIGNIGSLNPFFEGINKFDDVSKKKEKSVDADEIIGKTANRTLDNKWNIKIQFGAPFFKNVFTYIKEMGYDVLFALKKKEIIIFKLDSSNNYFSYIKIGRTEVSEYINTDITDVNFNETSEQTDKPEEETVVFVEMDVLDEMNINEKYPIDLYFDTKETNSMYIINGKAKEARRLIDLSNNNPTVSTYPGIYNILLKHLGEESSYPVHVRKESIGNILSYLKLKKTKKDKSSTNALKIKFSPSEIDFIIETDTSTSSIQLYGDDIQLRPTKTSTVLLELDYILKFGKLQLENNVILHINEDRPFIIESKFGAGNIKIYYFIAPRVEEQT